MTFDPEFFKQQLATMATEAEAKPDPIHMLNMIRFRDVAEYRSHEAPDGPAPSGREAYGTYSAHAIRFIEALGGTVAWMSPANTTMIGPKGEHWDTVLTVRYPNRAAFVEMITSPDYQAITHHRTAAVADSRLIMMEIPEG